MPDYYEKPMYLLHHGYMDTCYTIQILNLVIQALPPRRRRYSYDFALSPYIHIFHRFLLRLSRKECVGAGGLFR